MLDFVIVLCSIAAWLAGSIALVPAIESAVSELAYGDPAAKQSRFETVMSGILVLTWPMSVPLLVIMKYAFRTKR